MSDQTKKFLNILQENRYKDLQLGSEYVYPAYEGNSILNIPSSICRMFNIPQIGAPSISADYLSSFTKKSPKRVLLILMDALSLTRFQKWVGEKKLPVWEKLIKNGQLFPLTSIVPSTTTTAMTTLWSGKAAAQHGVAGYELWLKEYGVVANMITQSPITYKNDGGSLEKAGFDPDNCLPVKTLGTHLKENGVQAHAFHHYSIAYSGLSRSYLRDAEMHSFSSAADLWVSLRELISTHLNEKLYLWTYWSGVDGLGHRHGPQNERVEAEFISFSDSFEKFFVNKLSPQEREDTLVILTADHGMVYTAKKTEFDLRYHPEFLDMLHIRPTGESRFTFLFVKPGCKEKVKEYVEKTWPDQFFVRETHEILESGLMGSEDHWPGIEDRTGDLILLARGDAFLWWSDKENPLLGRHGGLTPDEMLVPFLISPL